MAEEDQQWLGIMTPFSGLRVLARSGQGLLGQSEELDELLAKVLGEEIKEGRCIKLQETDDVKDDVLEAKSAISKRGENGEWSRDRPE